MQRVEMQQRQKQQKFILVESGSYQLTQKASIKILWLNFFNGNLNVLS